MINENELHEEIRNWIEKQGWEPESLDDLVYTNDFVEPFMNLEQRDQAQYYLDQFNEL
jgi:hypothetical protein